MKVLDIDLDFFPDNIAHDTLGRRENTQKGPCDWVSSVTFVKHPSYKCDKAGYAFRNHDVGSGVLQLKVYKKPREPWVFCCEDQFVERADGQGVLFNELNGSTYVDDGRFDAIILNQSPEFTPKESDLLLDTFCQYINTGHS